MPIEQIKKIHHTLPTHIRKPLYRAVLLFAGWMLLYHFVLKPIHIPDDQLTAFVQWGTAGILRLFYPVVQNIDQSVFINGIRAVNIDPQCNGLELIVLFLGFIICLPTRPARMLSFGIVGTLIISVLNMMRCAALASMYLNHMPIANFAHHFAFKLIIYGVVFYGWVLYSKKYKPNASEA